MVGREVVWGLQGDVGLGEKRSLRTAGHVVVRGYVRQAPLRSWWAIYVRRLRATATVCVGRHSSGRTAGTAPWQATCDRAGRGARAGEWWPRKAVAADIAHSGAPAVAPHWWRTPAAPAPHGGQQCPCHTRFPPGADPGPPAPLPPPPSSASERAKPLASHIAPRERLPTGPPRSASGRGDRRGRHPPPFFAPPARVRAAVWLAAPPTQRAPS